MSNVTDKIKPSLPDLATETLYVPHLVLLTAGRSPLSLVPDTSQPTEKSGLSLVLMVRSYTQVVLSGVQAAEKSLIRNFRPEAWRISMLAAKAKGRRAATVANFIITGDFRCM